MSPLAWGTSALHSGSGTTGLLWGTPIPTMRALSLIMHLLSTYYVLVLEIKVIMAQKSLCYGAFFRAVTVRCFHILFKAQN